jgi:uncharacterized protein YPO0396
MAWQIITVALLGVALIKIEQNRRIGMSNQDRINAVADKLDKAKNEVVGAIDELKAQVAAGETLDFTRLEGAAQALDDVVPDAAPEVPAEPETPAEPEAPVEGEGEQPTA